MSLEQIERRVPPKVTPGMRWQHQTRMVQEAYNEFKRELNQNYRQVTLLYYKFRQYEIKPGNQTAHHRRKEKVEG
jgi:hypothetical protein